MIGDLNLEQIHNLLRSERVGRLGCQQNGRVYVVPLTYACDDQYVYFHTKEGLKVRMMRENPQVCFEVDYIENMANWQSVIIWGTYEELTGDAAESALRLINNRVIPMITSQTCRPLYGLDRVQRTADAATKMVVFRIKIEEASGRYEKSQ